MCTLFNKLAASYNGMSRKYSTTSRGNIEESPVGSHHGYMQHKITKLQQGFEFQPVSTIFKNCYIFVNGFTDPPRNEIQRLVSIHGGNFDSYQTSRTTHFLCDVFPNTKLKELRKPKRIRIYYVTVQWLMQSIGENRKLPEAAFLPKGLANQHGVGITKFIPVGTTSTHKSIASTTDSTIQNSDSWVVSTEPEVSAVPVHRTGDSSTCVSLPAAATSPQSKQSLMWKLSEALQEDWELEPQVGLARGLSGEQGPTSTPQPGSLTVPPKPNPLAAQPAPNSSPAQPAPFVSPDTYRVSERRSSDPNFVQKYFETSRLHFIGSWKARLPELLATMTRKEGVALSAMPPPAPRRATAPFPAGRGRVVVHVDMDCFFVSVLLRDRSEEYRNFTPVAVAHSKSAGSSEISSCNYVARAFGISNGMFMSRAKELCPQLQVVHYDFKQYELASEQIYRIFFGCMKPKDSDPQCPYLGAVCVQPVSVDEVFLEYPPGTDGPGAARALREKIFEVTKCTASAGIGPNILLARLATRQGKPNGQFQVSVEQAEDFMATVPIRSLPGVGWKLGKKMKEKGISTCKELWSYPEVVLSDWFGASTGVQLYHWSRGIDSRALTPVQERKSVGAEVNWGLRFTKKEDVERFLEKLSEEMSQRLSQAAMAGKTITLKLKKRKPEAVEARKYLGHGHCDNVSKSFTFPHAVRSSPVIFRKSWNLFTTLPITVLPEDVRGMGIQMSRLEHVPDEFSEPQSTLSENRGGTIFQWATPRDHQTRQFGGTVEDNIDPPGARAGSTTRNGSKMASSTSGQSNGTMSSDIFIPSQIDEDVLRELPADIQQAVQRRGEGSSSLDNSPRRQKRKALFADLLRERGTLEAEDDVNMDGRTSTAAPETSVPLMSQGGDYIIPSQIDMSVLAELPTQIQQAVQKRSIGENAVKRRRGSGRVTTMTGLFDAAVTNSSAADSSRGSGGIGPVGVRHNAVLPPMHSMRSPAPATTPTSTSTMIADKHNSIRSSPTELNVSPSSIPFSLTQQMDFMCNMPAELMEDVWEEMCAGYRKHQTADRSVRSSSVENSPDVIPAGAANTDGNDDVDEWVCPARNYDSGLGLAPSALLPHKEMSAEALQYFLQLWDWDHIDVSKPGGSDEESDVTYSTKNTDKRNAYQVQALVSYASWLVIQGRLDKVRSFVKTIKRVRSQSRTPNFTADKWWERAEVDVTLAAQMAAVELFHCAIDMN